jgi:predicted metalloprotease
MSLNENASIDTSQVRDVGSGGGGGLRGLPIGGGGGIIGLIVLALLVAGGVIGGNALFGGGDAGQPVNCTTANPDRLNDVKCRDALYVNSIQNYWQKALPQTFGVQYQKAVTTYFSGAVDTGCGQADSGVGPFYCSSDNTVYLDTSFWDELANRFGAPGQFAQPYVLAHEYGHHVQDLLGTLADVQRQMQRDPANQNALSVKLELQADCYAGVWAKHAPETRAANGQPIFTSVTAADVKQAMDAAGAVGDDAIQKKMGGGVDESSWTHGSSAQRERWFNTGYTSGNAKSCTTFS